MTSATIKKPHYIASGEWITIDDYFGARMMDETTVLIMGILIPISYRIHAPSYVEWKLSTNIDEEEFTVEERELLNVLLRVHYSNFIEAAVREASFHEDYARSHGFSCYDEQVDAYRIAAETILRKEESPF